jgi:hypothetical protein
MLGYILAYIAIALFTIVYLIDGIIILFFEVKNKKWYELTSKKSKTKAFRTDVIANWLFPDTWTFLFSWKGGYKFGRFGETLSSVLGKKKMDKSLSWVGKFFYYFLYAIDGTSWFKGGHCFVSIASDEDIQKFIDTNNINIVK